jgi:nitrate reductase cytochrome c-type subunit
MKKITRREVLGSIGIAAGASTLSSGSLNKTLSNVPTEEAKLPWPYAKLDPDATAEIAYGYPGAPDCMYRVFTSIVSQLGERLGEPYKSFPCDVMRYGACGVHGWGSLCGAINGAAAIIGLVSRTTNETWFLANELFVWYEESRLPIYVPKQPKLEMEVSACVSKSILCHVSVANWCRASGYKAMCEERAERCVRLTAETTKKLVELLNNCFSGTPIAVAGWGVNEETKRCMSCHGLGKKEGNARGKMNCTSCHSSLSDKHPEFE